MADRFAAVLSRFTSGMDRLVPEQPAMVLRTSPDFDDQARELVAALGRAGWQRLTVLVDPGADPGAAGSLSCPVVSARSLRGLWRYWRAEVVIHSHGIYGSRPGSRRKRFLNVWHGMPVKRLPDGSDVGRHQTDRTIATAGVHARHLAETWGIGLDRVAITGLPRNDVLHPSRRGPRPAALTALAGDGPLVVWLPTFRAQAGTGTVDGVDTGSVTQFAGADPAAVDAVLARLGAHGILKPHPLAPRPERLDAEHLSVWSDRDLAAAGLTLYQLLAHADVLISDHSSVWIDFLLTGRPMAFAVSDLDAYRASRGFYFDDIEALLPGPLATDLDELEAALVDLLAGDDRWTDRRRESLGIHHVHQDDRSADRVAALALSMLRGRVPQAVAAG